MAPIYQATKADEEGNDVRNGIYLPEGQWVDYFTGDIYEGNRIVNNFEAPLWKLPVFVKRGAIIPMTTAHNNIYEMDKALRVYELYPFGQSEFTEYDDDGTTEQYRKDKFVTTHIASSLDEKGNLTVTIDPAQGDYEGFVREKTTELRINVTAKPKKLTAMIGKRKVKLTEVNSLDEFNKGENVYFYNEAPQLNRFATPGSEFAKVSIVKTSQRHKP